MHFRKTSGDVHMVFGSDSDLILLALSSVPLTHSYVVLRDPKATWKSPPGSKTKNRARAPRTAKSLQTIVFSTRRFMSALENQFSSYNTDRIREDFILLSILTGNDYLPRMKYMPIHRSWSSYSRCVQNYMDLG